MTAKAKKPGDALIGIGTVIAVLGIVIYVLALASGGPGNPLLAFAMVVIGLLMAILGYVKRGSTR
ncbi:hypothetical protein [Paenarthrobacter ilicis]|uniref:hypothetical protein n=1 Tax=Paenarthrobacter ilicis TaxID=43665 RepID=UPI0028D71422|nr:hypothetical protein [Paenarthrobacter ilicis]